MEKDDNEFPFRDKSHTSRRNTCIQCTKEQRKQYYEDNKEEFLTDAKNYYQENKEDVLETVRQYRIDNKEKITERRKENYKENREEILLDRKNFSSTEEYKQKRNTRNRKRRKENPEFKFRTFISNIIREHIKDQKGSKRGKSIIDNLPYSIQELKDYIENLFEPWMTWENWGKYDLKTWDDNDPATWTWQLDHIIPCSDLLYSSMTDPNFLKCWALENLRPLSAKQNVIEGAARKRHKNSRV